jgi:hypothetical protein
MIRLAFYASLVPVSALGGLALHDLAPGLYVLAVVLSVVATTVAIAYQLAEGSRDAG